MFDKNNDDKSNDIFTYKPSGILSYQNCGWVTKIPIFGFQKSSMK
jgi:hypothetical protein